jgi:hypothetical protein
MDAGRPNDDVCSRMLKKVSSGVLESENSSTCRGEKSRSWPAQGWAGETNTYASGFSPSAALLEDLFEHPEEMSNRFKTMRGYIRG